MVEINIFNRLIWGLCLLLAGVLSSAPTLQAQHAGTFWQHWGDGKAEVNTYELSVPRYGEERSAQETVIFVTEDFDGKSQVKIDREVPQERKIPVMKLHRIRNFQTGAYPYNMTLSAFSPLRKWALEGQEFPLLTPIKVAFSSTEWCGVFYQQLNSSSAGYVDQMHSYFDGEVDKQVVHPLSKRAIFEDDLLVRARELIVSFPAGSYQMLASPMYARLGKDSVKWIPVQVERELLAEPLETPLGKSKAVQYRVVSEHRTHTIWVEDSGARRVLKWGVDFGDEQVEQATIQESRRFAYWKLQSNADQVG